MPVLDPLNEAVVFWLILAVLYGYLAWSNLRWYLKVRNLDQSSGSSLYIQEEGIGILNQAKSESDIKVTDMFRSIAVSDIFGLLLGLLAAIWSLVTL